MVYDSNKTPNQLDTLTSPDNSDVTLLGDASDSYRVKQMTFSNLKTWIEGFSTYFNKTTAVLNDISNVDAGSPSDGQLLVYEAATTSWKPNTSSTANGSTTVAGKVETATSAEVNAGTATGGTGAALAVTPDALAASNYASQLPTSGQKSALTGNNTDIAVGASNTFVTQTGFQKGAERYAADAGGSDAYAVTLSPVPTSYATGMSIHFKANTANTGAATLNVNSLGAKTIKKGVNTDLDTGDIAAGQIVQVIYDGTNFVLQSPVANTFRGLSGSGATTHDMSSTTTKNIAHGLGVTPTLYTITGVSSTGYTTFSVKTTAVATAGAAASNVFLFFYSAGNVLEGSISADSTNITITWSKTGSPTGTAQLIWWAIA